MVQTGIQRAFGSKLRAILGQRFANSHAFLPCVTEVRILQSSTATGLMTASFTAELLQAWCRACGDAGCQRGTTLIVQVLSFDVVLISPALILVGHADVPQGLRTQAHDLGRVFIGLGLMLPHYVSFSIS